MTRYLGLFRSRHLSLKPPSSDVEGSSSPLIRRAVACRTVR